MIQLKLSSNAKIPTKGSMLSAGYDLSSCEDEIIPVGTRKLIPTGIYLELCPANAYLRVAPRSGLACKGIDVGAGVVDSDYRGQIKVIVINNSQEDFIIMPGDRIAQLIPTMINTSQVSCVDSDNKITYVSNISEVRGSCGFGSTGK